MYAAFGCKSSKVYKNYSRPFLSLDPNGYVLLRIVAVTDLQEGGGIRETRDHNIDAFRIRYAVRNDAVVLSLADVEERSADPIKGNYGVPQRGGV